MCEPRSCASHMIGVNKVTCSGQCTRLSPADHVTSKRRKMLEMIVRTQIWRYFYCICPMRWSRSGHVTSEKTKRWTMIVRTQMWQYFYCICRTRWSRAGHVTLKKTKRWRMIVRTFVCEQNCYKWPSSRDICKINFQTRHFWGGQILPKITKKYTKIENNCVILNIKIELP
jgi:hypothetical protein